MSTHLLPAPALARALARANLSFTTYVILDVVRAGRPNIPHISQDTGLSYHAVRNQIMRTPHFVIHFDRPLITITATPQAIATLAKIQSSLE